MARPKIKIDEDEVARLALLNCHTRTIAKILGYSENTIRRRCGALIEEKRAEHRAELRKAQYEKATIGKDAGLLMFLGKNELDQTDKQIIVDETQVKELSESEQLEARRLASLRLRKGWQAVDFKSKDTA